MNKTVILSITILFINIAFASNANAYSRGFGGYTVKECYHHNVDNNGYITDSALVGEFQVDLACDENPAVKSKADQHHLTGLVLNPDGTYTFMMVFTDDEKHNHPNCVIDSSPGEYIPPGI